MPTPSTVSNEVALPRQPEDRFELIEDVVSRVMDRIHGNWPHGTWSANPSTNPSSDQRADLSADQPAKTQPVIVQQGTQHRLSSANISPAAR